MALTQSEIILPRIAGTPVYAPASLQGVRAMDALLDEGIALKWSVVNLPEEIPSGVSAADVIKLKATTKNDIHYAQHD